MLFTREVFSDYVSWLMLTRPERLDILTHPITRSQTLDHTTRALLLGTPAAIDRPMREAVVVELLASGRAEESLVDATRKHRGVTGRNAIWAQAKNGQGAASLQPPGMTGAPGRI